MPPMVMPSTSVEPSAVAVTPSVVVWAVLVIESILITPPPRAMSVMRLLAVDSLNVSPRVALAIDVMLP